MVTFAGWLFIGYAALELVNAVGNAFEDKGGMAIVATLFSALNVFVGLSLLGVMH